jgi:creatinine amidohydrolase/Fe(II)-dependent formamide hydrolase-like protein
MLLCLRPELVDLEAAQGAHAPFASAFYSPYSSRASRVAVSQPFERVSVSGAYGHPELASAEKGAALFNAVVAEIVACIREIAAWPALEPH